MSYAARCTVSCTGAPNVSLAQCAGLINGSHIDTCRDLQDPCGQAPAGDQLAAVGEPRTGILAEVNDVRPVYLPSTSRSSETREASTLETAGHRLAFAPELQGKVRHPIAASSPHPSLSALHEGGNFPKSGQKLSYGNSTVEVYQRACSLPPPLCLWQMFTSFEIV